MISKKQVETFYFLFSPKKQPKKFYHQRSYGRCWSDFQYLQKYSSHDTISLKGKYKYDLPSTPFWFSVKWPAVWFGRFSDSILLLVAARIELGQKLGKVLRHPFIPPPPPFMPATNKMTTCSADIYRTFFKVCRLLYVIEGWIRSEACRYIFFTTKKFSHC